MTEKAIAASLLSYFGNNYRPTSICLFEWHYRKTPHGLSVKNFYTTKVLMQKTIESGRSFSGFYIRILKKSVEVISNHKYGNVGQILLLRFKMMPDESFKFQNMIILAKR
jgi:hypothetical protein